VVIAAGRGKRLRPITDHWPKPVLPIDGEPVIVTLLGDLAAAGVDRIVVVTGHLAEQVEALLAPLPHPVRFAHQPEPDGSLDAVRRADARAPFLVTAADTRFAPGDVGRFVAAARDTEAALAVRQQEGRPASTRVHVEDGRVVRLVAPEAPGPWTAAPLWWLGTAAAAHLDDDLPGPPYELAAALQKAIDAGLAVSAIQVGETRDLTTPVDLVRENFPYLR
jgi:NDP-sugar pyrophosphorylase family protein